MLRELADDGVVESRHKKLHRPGTLPHVVMADVTARDRDGELIAVADRMGRGSARRRAQDPYPRRVRKARPGEVAGVGDRALLRVEKSDTDGEHVRLLRPRHQDPGPRQAARRSAFSARCRVAAAGSRRSTRNSSAANSRSRAGATGDAQDGDLCAVESRRRAADWACPRRRVVERLGSIKSEKAVSLIAINAHGIPHVFPPAVLKEAEAAQPPSPSGREDWRKVPLVTIDPADAKDHDDAVHAEPDSDPKNQGWPCRLRRHRRRRRLCAARHRRSTARRASAATRSISRIGSCRCCRSASPMICARCARMRTAPRWQCGW